MTDIRELIEQYDSFSTVMIVHPEPDVTDGLVEILTEAGINVLGPVGTASVALAIAAQARADLALVSPKLAGRRNGAELAQRLEDIWGVRAVLLPA